MSDIVNIINGLGGAIERLEAAAVQQEQKLLYLQQQDLFNEQSKQEDNVSRVDPNLIASKLDSAIQKVEQILQEA